MRRDLLGRRPGRRGDRARVAGSQGAALHAAAFFDLDRTLMEGSSGFYWARAARAAGMISRRRLAADAWANIQFRLRGSTDAAAEVVLKRVGQVMSGVAVRDLQRLAPRVLAGILPRLYPQMLEVAYRHQDEGRPIYICTAASQELAELLAHVLGFDGGLGTRSEVIDGRYTGRLAGPFSYREGKAQAIRELAQREEIDLGASYAYSDSESDLPMLRAVGHPVAVNPDAELSRVAREEGWEVLRFDRLGRRLKVLGAALAAAAVSGAGGTVVAGRRAAGAGRGARSPGRRSGPAAGRAARRLGPLRSGAGR